MTHFLPIHRKEAAARCLLLLGCSFCLLFPALYNGFPLVTPDTGAYIGNGWLLHVPVDRPLTYSIFLRITSLSGLSLWGVVWAQTFILVYYLKRVTQKILGAHYSPRVFFAIILVMSVCTSVSWVTSQLMPDIFTAILILCIIDFYFSPSGGRWRKAISFFTLWFFMEQHNSNLLLVLICCILARLYSLVRRNRWFIRKTAFLFVVTLFSFVSISFFNLWEGNSFRPSAGTHVFLMARMAENGILDQYLSEYCPTEHYSLCRYQGQTGNRQWEFMWINPSLPHSKGWDKAENEYNRIILGSLTKPKYLALHLYESLEGTLRQLTQVTVGLMPQQEGTGPDKAIQTYFPRERKEYLTSLQQQNGLSSFTPFFNALAVLFFTLAAATTFLLYRRTDATRFSRNWAFLLIVTLVCILINAFVTSTFSTVIDRLQTRVCWLLPFCVLLFLLKYYFRQSNVNLRKS